MRPLHQVRRPVDWWSCQTIEESKITLTISQFPNVQYAVFNRSGAWHLRAPYRLNQKDWKVLQEPLPSSAQTSVPSRRRSITFGDLGAPSKAAAPSQADAPSQAAGPSQAPDVLAADKGVVGVMHASRMSWHLSQYAHNLSASFMCMYRHLLDRVDLLTYPLGGGRSSQSMTRNQN